MKYILTKDTATIEGKAFTVYGIAPSGGSNAFILGESRAEAERLVCLLNKEKIPEEHFRDILEDYLSDRDTFAVKYL
ncbi:MAG: hypothetical protein IJL63_04990 [Clostridia bacterium]|nr:hypothetical protein [Clostridia bacterium]